MPLGNWQQILDEPLDINVEINPWKVFRPYPDIRIRIPRPLAHHSVGSKPFQEIPASRPHPRRGVVGSRHFAALLRIDRRSCTERRARWNDRNQLRRKVSAEVL